ncbi:MAG: PAS domain S-box protein [Desulfobacter sp.]|nr:MAG: PAS domain S-box protein [Desulfobacter sp.]
MKSKRPHPNGILNEKAGKSPDEQEQLHSIIGLGKFSARKSYYPELQKKIRELQKAQSYIINIIDSMPSVLVGVDVDLKVTHWNKTAERATGITSDAACTQNLSDVMPSLEPLMGEITESIHSGEIKTEHQCRRSSTHDDLYEDIAIYPLLRGEVEGAVIRIDDVTEKIQMQEMMLQSEKMLSVGGLAAGMAHEINNPLAGMLQTADVLAGRLGGRDLAANQKAAEEAGTTMAAITRFMAARRVPQMFEAITASGKRVAQIVSNMLSFARKSDAIVSSHDLPELLDRTIELASTDYDLKKRYDFKTIEIVKEYEDNLPLLPCEAGKIQQVILNILRNGAHAMQESPDQKAPQFILRLASEKNRRMLRMEIEDNGPGMAASVRKRVFEPFFTTKSTGVGTGLGLSVSYFIIKENHGGDMRVESTPGVGTKFIIHLPLPE